MLSVTGVVMLHVQEAAALAQRSPETVRRWVWSGRLPAERQGRRLLVARDDVLRVAGVDVPEREVLTLTEWAGELHADEARENTAKTASDLVFADRAERSG